MFDRVQTLHAAGKPIWAIAEETGVSRRIVAKWIQTGFLQHRRQMPPKPSSPAYFREFLTRQ
jgi:transposase-like protein